MVTWALLLISTLIVVELFLRLPLIAHAKELADTLQKSLKVLKSPRISDHWKEKTLQAYSLRLFKHSIVVFLLLVAALSPFAAIDYLAARSGNAIAPLLESIEGLIVSTLFAIAYFVIRQRVINRLGA